MHELGITQSIIDACSAEAQGTTVARVTVEIGCLCGVQSDAMRFCYDVCAQGTSLEGSVLDIEAVPGRGKCRDCGQEMPVQNYFWLCACGSADIEISGGDQLRIKEMEIR
jgi:hydrogenase nickel incorporation protein HypA/HybF